MASHFLDTKKSYLVKDYYYNAAKKADNWQQATLDLTVSAAGKVDWKITMKNWGTNDVPNGRAVYLIVNVAGVPIAGQAAYPDYWPGNSNYMTYGFSNNPNYANYPTLSGSSAHGSFTLSNTSAKTVSVSMRICCMQMYDGHVSDHPDNIPNIETTLTRDTWEDSIAPASAPSITVSSLNKFKIEGVNGTAGKNNAVKASTIYYTLNGTQGSVANLSTTSAGAVSATIDASAYKNESSLEIKAWVSNTFTRESGSKTSAQATKTFKAISSPSISITDNKNNTFKLNCTGATAAADSNNAVSSNTFTWGYDTSYDRTHTTNSVIYNLQESDAASTNVYGRAVSVPANFGVTKTIYLNPNPTAITYYVAPGNPGKPVISYTKSRLTIKEPWTFSWTAAKPGNSYSHNAVKGYRIRLYKNDINIPIFNSSGGQLSVLSGITDGDYIYDSESTTTSITIDPTKHGFAVGDIVELGIYAYSKNGIGGLLFSGNNTNEQISNASEVQNAGIMRIKISDAWKEGQVWLKVNNAWQEAETINVKTATGWMESQ